MVYLLGVVIAATYLPWHASVTSAVLSLFCFDFFFVPSVFTFQFADKQNLLTGLILLAVGVITSALASERRRQTKAAAEAAMLAREEQLRSSLLASISHGLRTSLAVIAGSASTLFENRDRPKGKQRAQGLGLAICRAIAQLHGMDISADNPRGRRAVCGIHQAYSRQRIGPRRHMSGEGPLVLVVEDKPHMPPLAQTHAAE